jgi:hypothetical protein
VTSAYYLLVPDKWTNFNTLTVSQEDAVVKLLEFLESPYQTTEKLIEEKVKVCFIFLCVFCSGRHFEALKESSFFVSKIGV